MKKHKYTCPKCGSRQAEIGEIRAAGGFWQKIFDIQNRKFTTLTCQRCRYTELYDMPSNKAQNVLDFFTT